MKLTKMKIGLNEEHNCGMFSISGRGNNLGMCEVLSSLNGVIPVRIYRARNEAHMTYNRDMSTWDDITKLFEKSKSKVSRMKH